MYSSFTAGYQFAFRSDHFSAYFTTLIACSDESKHVSRLLYNAYCVIEYGTLKYIFQKKSLEKF